MKRELRKPSIIVPPPDPDDPDGFTWLSDGWFRREVRNTVEARTLMAKASECVKKGESRAEVISLLREAGFQVEESETAVPQRILQGLRRDRRRRLG